MDEPYLVKVFEYNVIGKHYLINYPPNLVWTSIINEDMQWKRITNMNVPDWYKTIEKLPSLKEAKAYVTTLQLLEV